MRALDRKLLRDLWLMRGQALAISLVIASGIATFVMFVSTHNALQATRDSFYGAYRFGEVFATLKRAPESLRERIAEIPAVQTVETRVVAGVHLEVDGFDEPIAGRLVSVPDSGPPLLNRLYLKSGRNLTPGAEREVLISDGFAEAHRLVPGDEFVAIIRGRRDTLRVVGIALSPEYVHQVRPGGSFPDYQRYGIVWMSRKALATAYEMEGAFNDVTLSLAPGANAQEVIDRLDPILAPLGGFGAYARKDQLSHRFLEEEFQQLERMAVMFPVIFLGVAAFLLHVVVARLIGTQREQIAALKAFGYTNAQVGLHYVKLILMMVGMGGLIGLVVGAWLGKMMADVYIQFFRFPYLTYELRLEVAALALGIAALAALGGTLRGISGAARLPPAEAMRPESPAAYTASWIERIGPGQWFSQPTRMIVRHVGRRPLKSVLSIVGIALACAIMMTGRFQADTIAYMIEVEYRLSSREDMTVSFIEPTSRRALFELESLPGVIKGEPFRVVPVVFRHGHRSYRSAIRGMEPGGDIQRLLDRTLTPVVLPPEGLMLTDYLAEMLHVRPGDTVEVELLEGSRTSHQVPVAGVVSQYIGVSGYMQVAALNTLMREGEAISGAYLQVDEQAATDLYRRLTDTPRVANIVIRKNEIQNFYEVTEQTMLFFTFVATIFAGIIAFGVVYNSARIALTERGRELASLRVLGFTRGEISYILLGELALFTLIAIPVGFVIGRELCRYIAEAVSNDLYRVPLILEADTYAFAATVVLVSAILSAWIVRGRLNRLDLIGVLKTRE